MPETLAETVGRWDLEGFVTTSGEFYNQIHERITFLRKLHFDQYIPTLGADQVTDFEMRLETWLGNIDAEDDQRTLIEAVPEIVFFGREEFTKLYQAALRGPVTRWVIELAGLDFYAADFDARLVEEIHRHTWFCSVSDSMQISDFCHANHLGGIDYRPDLRTLSKFGDFTKVLRFMHDPRNGAGGAWPLRRVVILEDFIGTGTQLEGAQPIVQELLNQGIPVLLVPLLICPEGNRRVEALFGRHPLFRSEPVLSLNSELFITATPPPSKPFAQRLSELAIRSYPRVIGNNAATPRPYTPFGFLRTGAMVVMYSNTPANTLPLIQHSSNTWQPLFPRSARVK